MKGKEGREESEESKKEAERKRAKTERQDEHCKEEKKTVLGLSAPNCT